MGRKLTQKFIAKELSKYSATLLSTYDGNRIPIKILCRCGTIFNKLYKIIKRTNKCRCKKCYVQVGPNKYTQKHVEEVISSYKAVLLSTYESNHIPLKILCSCENIFKKCFKHIIKTDRCICPECSAKLYGRKYKYTQSEVENIFNVGGCVLKSVYRNANIPVYYQCSCSNHSFIIINSFMNGGRCMKCSRIDISGENSWNWNPNLTDEERNKNREREIARENILNMVHGALQYSNVTITLAKYVVIGAASSMFII